MPVRTLFVSKLYEASLATEAGFAAFNAELVAACRAIAAQDKAGQGWSREHGYGGYTSYASLDDLTRRDSLFDDLRRREIALHAVHPAGAELATYRATDL